MKESTFSRQVKEYSEKRGAVVYVNTASVYDVTGRPDMEIFYKAHTIACELKTGRYKMTNEQIIQLTRLREVGIIAIELRDTIDELKLIMDLIDNGNISEYTQPELPKLKVGDLFD